MAEELRGWNWHQPPLEPIYDVKLALYEIANQYCSTGRDLFLRRVMKVQAKPNKAMLFGSVFHEIVARLLVQVKRLIYEKGVGGYKDVISQLETLTFAEVTGVDSLACSVASRFDELDGGEREELLQKCQLLLDFERARVVGRMHDVLARQPYIGADALAATVVPVVVEQKLDGSFLGLSSNLSADAFTFSEPMISDLKFGEQQRFHRLATTGYSLVLEALHDFPISIGCIVYAQFKHGRVLVQRDFHLIDDELRQWFVEERDRKARMLADEIDPGLPEECYATCPYLEYCC